MVAPTTTKMRGNIREKKNFSLGDIGCDGSAVVISLLSHNAYYAKARQYWVLRLAVNQSVSTNSSSGAVASGLAPHLTKPARPPVAADDSPPSAMGKEGIISAN
jgi:hypothetical protein